MGKIKDIHIQVEEWAAELSKELGETITPSTTIRTLGETIVYEGITNDGLTVWQVDDCQAWEAPHSEDYVEIQLNQPDTNTERSKLIQELRTEVQNLKDKEN